MLWNMTMFAVAGNVRDRHLFLREHDKSIRRNPKSERPNMSLHVIVNITCDGAVACHRFATSAPRYDYASIEQ